MENDQPNSRNLNTLSRIPVVARALADVLHENGLAVLGRFNEGMCFSMSREQERVLRDNPVTFVEAIERHQPAELS